MRPRISSNFAFLPLYRDRGSFLASLVFVRSAKLADEYYVRVGNLSFGERRSEPEEGCTMSGVKGVHGGASV